VRVRHGDAGTYLVELTDAERAALAWAAETGRALLLGDPDISLLTRETAFGAELLDRLADHLVLAGIRPAHPDRDSRASPGWRLDASAHD
jgi:hypothetical protein